jgi:hypothetical protein
VAEVEITHVTKAGVDHRSITHIGGPAQGGWELTTTRAIQNIQSHAHNFYVVTADGLRAEVGVVDADPPYIRTFVNGQATNHLLLLPTWGPTIGAELFTCVLDERCEYIARSIGRVENVEGDLVTCGSVAFDLTRERVFTTRGEAEAVAEQLNHAVRK